MYAIAKRADAETDYLLAEYEADAAYDAYIKCLRAEKEAAANSKIELDGAELVDAINKATINKGGQPQ